MTDKCTKHWGDCTYYASLVNGNPTDGICTCGYGWTVFTDSGGVDDSQLHSVERREQMRSAPAEPWVEAADAFNRVMLATPDTVAQLVEITRLACIQHAASVTKERDALLLERDTLRDDIEEARGDTAKAITVARTLQKALGETIVPLAEREHLTNERDELKAKQPWVKALIEQDNELQAIRAQVARLTNEHNLLRTALNALCSAVETYHQWKSAHNYGVLWQRANEARAVLSSKPEAIPPT